MMKSSRGWVPERMEKGLRGWMVMLIIVAYAPDARQHQRKLGLACPLSHTPAPFQTRSRTEGNVLSMSLKYNFEAERNPIILLRTKTSAQTKGNNERTPPVNAVASISNIKYVNWATIQNMTNGPWLRQAYNGLLLLVIKCFHLVQKFQIFLSHHLFHQIYGQRPPALRGKMLIFTLKS